MIGIVLAGGNSRRFGSDKLLVEVKGKPLISYALESLSKSRSIDRIVIITSEEKREVYRVFGYPVFIDNLLVGPIGGIYLALENLGDCFVLAGDMPLVNPSLIDIIIEHFYKEHCQACVPIWSNGYLEPLCAAYSRTLTHIFWKHIVAGEYSLWKLIMRTKACFIKIEQLPEEFRTSFFNVNTSEDLKKLLSILRNRKQNISEPS